ncbi:hypothetical protein J2W97_002053 [Paenibacillus jamilae]|jgi:hypothetical protein|uniref:hypothetical protein n=1 Tax=Paenibacillus TaxID=44249 RepID=UPI000D30950B|nr:MULTISPECIES: hypothetical protein [Paenibacillus]MDP9676058.1 hypothetical protein [Paenibacillus jamilae]KAF6618407.1 hypothetical protein HFE00_10025 [Paenibacillus sp. EKM101P]KAF6624753.1 hypothetical protein HFE03_04190 [Paenibacillus sp. EKM102P]KAF6635467.1 hypothetical protein HFE01_00845 [Paenibacillus sp. EKM10P]KAF6648823.1 hypothetical protein HFE02_10710 [Paenibacillus sp. EKM11P]
MKAVPKVNTNGLYLEDELVDDAFSGVVPFYTPSSPTLSDTNQQLDTHRLADSSSSTIDVINSESTPAGYTVGIPVPPGLYHPRFDIQGWLVYEAEYAKNLLEAQKAFDQLNNESQALFQEQYDEWRNKPENERGDEPIYPAPTFKTPERRDPATFWSEGLSEEEIKELTQKAEQQPSETDQLKQRIADLEVTLSQLMLGGIGK